MIGKRKKRRWCHWVCGLHGGRKDTQRWPRPANQNQRQCAGLHGNSELRGVAKFVGTMKAVDCGAIPSGTSLIARCLKSCKHSSLGIQVWGKNVSILPLVVSGFKGKGGQNPAYLEASKTRKWLTATSEKIETPGLQPREAAVSY